MAVIWKKPGQNDWLRVRVELKGGVPMIGGVGSMNVVHRFGGALWNGMIVMAR